MLLGYTIQERSSMVAMQEFLNKFLEQITGTKDILFSSYCEEDIANFFNGKINSFTVTALCGHALIEVTTYQKEGDYCLLKGVTIPMELNTVYCISRGETILDRIVR